ncbi:MAG: 5-formyltetrahydrofolate cyclo-ligase [Helicobacteraceae bacterium]|nr:5-formyltetrahydrofolate cyclo-ligase [Helicobacteraceae bacterium]
MEKSQFRNLCLKSRKKETTHNLRYKNHIANQKLSNILKNLTFKNALFYWPLDEEIDFRETIKTLRRDKKEIFLPFMQGNSFKMVNFRLPLKRKKFEIFEAGNSLKDNKKIDIVIVPIVGIDVNFARVGFGKGMYDRFFETLKNRPITIFVQPQLCYTNENICNEHDIQSNLVLTYSGCYNKKRIRSVRLNTHNGARCTSRWSSRFFHL